MKIKILGAEIDNLTQEEILKKTEEAITGGKQLFIATANPEILVLAGKDNEFKNIIDNADIKIADGFGLKIGAKILGKRLPRRITGVDLMEQLCFLASQKGWKIYFLGGGSGVARQAAINLEQKIPGLKIVGAESGNGKVTEMDEWDNRVIIQHINATEPVILFVALGQGKQEKWIFDHLKKLTTVKIAMGVGGAFDFFAKKIKRAPKWMRSLGLEWLWRFFREPKRYGRIFNATIVFPFLCLSKRIKS